MRSLSAPRQTSLDLVGCLGLGSMRARGGLSRFLLLVAAFALLGVYVASAHLTGSTPINYDAIVIPGGGVAGGIVDLGRDHPSVPVTDEPPHPTAWTMERLRAAAEVYHDAPANAKPKIISLSAGTPHKPMPRDQRSGFAVMEAEASAATLLREFAVPPEDVLEVSG